MCSSDHVGLALIWTQEIVQACEIRPPQLELDARIPLLDPDADDFPLLRYGRVVPYAKLAEFAKKKDLKVYSFVSTAVERYLWLRCGDLTLKPFTIVCPLSTTKEYLISLWSTKDLCKRRKVKSSRERRALDILRRELDLGEQPAMWYWDFTCGPG